MMMTLPSEYDLHRPLTHQILGINNVVYSRKGGAMAYSNVRMCVTIVRGDAALEVSLASELDKVRPTERIRGMAFSESGDRLFIAAADTVYALDAETGRTLWTYQPPRSFGFLVISPVALSASAGRVAASFDNGSVAVWKEDGTLTCLWHDNDSPREMQLSLDGDRLVGTDSFTISIWSQSARRKVVRSSLDQRAFGFAASPDGDLVAIRTLRDVVLMSPVSREVVATIPSDPGLPVMAFHPDRPEIAIAARNVVRWFDFSGQERRRMALDAGELVLSLAFDPTGKELAIGTSAESLLRIEG